MRQSSWTERQACYGWFEVAGMGHNKTKIHWLQRLNKTFAFIGFGGLFRIKKIQSVQSQMEGNAKTTYQNNLKY